MRKHRIIVRLLLCVFASAAPLRAHHSVDSSYDTSQLVSVTGVITSLEWHNPHVTFHVAVKNGDGSTSDWRMEMKGTRGLSALGLDQRDVAVGMQVSARVFTAKNGTKSGNVRNLLLPDGRNVDVGDTFPRR